ncbi:MAG: DUF1819 family protein [Bacteroidetes bacterium]|nr:DUF1819 family protein [Bacteroidota bacterium]
MNESAYSASFSAGSLLHKETTALLPILLSENPEELIKLEIKQNNLLKINSESSRKRTVSEIIKRLSTVDQPFWEYYSHRIEEEQKLLLFYLCLKLYRIMFDFHFNVTLQQWNSSSPVIEPFLYQMELNEISGKEDTVFNWTDKTKAKIISVYMKILKDIGILNAESYRLQELIVDNSFYYYFVQKRELWFLDACLLNIQTKKNIIDSAL